MVVLTDSERVRTSRRLVMELLGSAADLSTAPEALAYIERYEAQPDRFGPDSLTVAQAVKVDNELYVRDYSKCILCYKCVEACGVDAQNTFAITVAGRGFGAHISTELDVPLPESACVYCGNCVAVCPTGALMAKSEFDLREAGEWREEEQTEVDTVCPYCGVGCNLTLHVQDDAIVKVTSPDDHDVTRGNLCIKGRFGYDYVKSPQARVTVELASLEELEPALAREEFDVARVFVGYGASAPSAPEPCRLPKVAYSLDRPAVVQRLVQDRRVAPDLDPGRVLGRDRDRARGDSRGRRLPGEPRPAPLGRLRRRPARARDRARPAAAARARGAAGRRLDDRLRLARAAAAEARRTSSAPRRSRGRVRPASRSSRRRTPPST